MSDIGNVFPPGFGVCLLSLGLIILCAAGLLICLLIAWLRTRGGAKRLREDAFFGWAVGAVASGAAAGISIALVNWSGSLGRFAHWIDQSVVTVVWMVALAALWPIVALIAHRRWRQKASV